MDIEKAIKNKNTLAFRQGAIGIVLNKQNQVLVVQMVAYKDNQWRFPGGGIDEGEKASEALLREFFEELGTDKFEIVAESKYKTEYLWKDEVIRMRFEKKNELYKGQQQQQFLVRFLGEEDDIKPDPGELKQVRWVRPDELQKYFVFPGQLALAQKVLKEFQLYN